MTERLKCHTSYLTVSDLEAAIGMDTSTHAWCEETGRWYRYETSGGAQTVDHDLVCATSSLGNTRWLSCGGDGGEGVRNIIVSNQKASVVGTTDGFSQGKAPFYSIGQAGPIVGTRTDDTTFTRSSGEWIANALVGQYAFSCPSGEYWTGSWLPITANTATALTVDGILEATGTAIYTCPWHPMKTLYPCTYGAGNSGNGMFTGGCFDGKNIWMAPTGSPDVIKISRATGTLTAYPHGYPVLPANAGAFQGAVWDGNSVWLVPCAAEDVVKINPVTGAMTGYPHNQQTYGDISGGNNYYFLGGCFDGQNLWLIANQAYNIVKLDVATGTMTEYPNTFHATCGGFDIGIFDGQNIWMGAQQIVVKLVCATGAMTSFSIPAEARAWPVVGGGTRTSTYIGGCFDGEFIWFAPAYGPLLKINPNTAAMEMFEMPADIAEVTAWPRQFNQVGGAAFDGTSIWLLPYNTTMLVKVNPTTGDMYEYCTGMSFAGGIWDGEHIWLMPCVQDPGYIAKVRPPEFGLAV